jgi:hypothetical protein
MFHNVVANDLLAQLSAQQSVHALIQKHPTPAATEKHFDVVRLFLSSAGIYSLRHLLRSFFKYPLDCSTFVHSPFFAGQLLRESLLDLSRSTSRKFQWPVFIFCYDSTYFRSHPAQLLQRDYDRVSM